MEATEQRPSSKGVLCAECGRRFSQPGGLKRHKCLIERAKPIEQQQDAVRVWRMSEVVP